MLGSMVWAERACLEVVWFVERSPNWDIFDDFESGLLGDLPLLGLVVGLE